jgi:asparagine synthase (glutamine-hydrolysing)
VPSEPPASTGGTPELPVVHGATLETVQAAVSDADPLIGARPGHKGCRGFAAVLSHPDGQPTYVRDVLGRYPLFVERAEPGTWAFDPRELDDPTPVPAGHVATPTPDGLLADGVWTLPRHLDSTVAGEDTAEGDTGEDDTPEDGGYWDDTAVLDGSDALNALETALDGAFASIALDGDPGLAVAFSGGVDSALVAASLDGPCYVAGFEGSHDLEAARSAADAMDLDLRTIEVTHDAIERAVPVVARATDRTNAMDVSIALSLYLVGERAAADGHDRLALGQGADELFGGYEKVVDPATDHRVDAESVLGAVRETMCSLPDGLERDVLALRAAGVEPVMPLLDDRVVRTALRLPAERLVSGDERKVALREVAERRLPAEVARREKKAVQYGSLVSRELDRLARRAGFKRRIDDHVGQYVRSRLE